MPTPIYDTGDGRYHSQGEVKVAMRNVDTNTQGTSTIAYFPYRSYLIGAKATCLQAMSSGTVTLNLVNGGAAGTATTVASSTATFVSGAAGSAVTLTLSSTSAAAGDHLELVYVKTGSPTVAFDVELHFLFRDK
jgi:hypothetical protein